MKQKICNSIAVLVLSFSKISFSQYYDPHNLNPQEWDVFAAQSRERQERQLSLDASACGDFIAAGVHSHQADSARFHSIMLQQQLEQNERIARQRKIEEEQSWQYANQNAESHVINNKIFVQDENNNGGMLYNISSEEKRRLRNDRNYRQRQFEAPRSVDELFYRIYGLEQKQ